MNKILKWLADYKPVQIVLFLLLVSILWAHLISWVSKYIPKQDFDKIHQIDISKGPFVVILTSVIIVPLIETYIYQSLIISLSQYFFKWEFSSYKTLVASAFLFGISHYYNYLMVIGALFAGCILYVCYSTFLLKKMNAFVFTFFVHALFNLYGYGIDVLFP